MEQLWINKLKPVNKHHAFAFKMSQFRKNLTVGGALYTKFYRKGKKDKSQNIDKMEKIYKIIDNSDVSDGSKALYKRHINKLLTKLNKNTLTILKDVPTVKKAIEDIYTNKESQKTLYNVVILISKLYKGINQDVYKQYRTIRDGLKSEIKEQKSENIIEDPNKWMSLDTLKQVPTMIQSEIESRFGSLFLSKEKYDALKKPQRIQYVKLFLRWGFIYTVIHYPLRLDYFNLPLSKTNTNYMLRN